MVKVKVGFLYWECMTWSYVDTIVVILSDTEQKSQKLFAASILVYYM